MSRDAGIRRAAGRWACAMAVVLLAACSGSEPVSSRGAAQAAERWVTAWAAGQMPLYDGSRTYRNRSARYIIHPSRGGTRLRLLLSNVQGLATAEIRGVRIGRRADGAALVPGSNVPVTFNGGETTVTLAPGAEVFSDPVALSYGFGEDLAVSLFLSGSHLPSGHNQSAQTSYITADEAGDVTADQSGAAFAEEVVPWAYVAALDVASADPRGTVVTVGDSITDGDHSTVGANRRWPDVLARRLALDGTAAQSVVNVGIGANHVLTGTAAFGGPSLLDRYPRDILAQRNVRYVIIMEGTNDIGLSRMPAPAIIEGLRRVAEACRAAGLKVYGGTITPAKGAYVHGDAVSVATRNQVNDWIRSGVAYDGVIDFAGAVADPDDPETLAAAYDSGDHLHPNDSGYEALAAAVPLDLLR